MTYLIFSCFMCLVCASTYVAVSAGTDEDNDRPTYRWWVRLIFLLATIYHGATAVSCLHALSKEPPPTPTPPPTIFVVPLEVPDTSPLPLS